MANQHENIRIDTVTKNLSFGKQMYLNYTEVSNILLNDYNSDAKLRLQNYYFLETNYLNSNFVLQYIGQTMHTKPFFKLFMKKEFKKSFLNSIDGSIYDIHSKKTMAVTNEFNLINKTYYKDHNINNIKILDKVYIAGHNVGTLLAIQSVAFNYLTDTINNISINSFQTVDFETIDLKKGIFKIFLDSKYIYPERVNYVVFYISRLQ